MDSDNLTPISQSLDGIVSQAQLEEIREIVFQNSLMTQVALPRKKIGGDTFERRFHRASLHIRAGDLYINGEWKKQIVPYGPKARLAQTHIDTQIIINNSCEVDIGNSYREFCRLLRLPVNGRTHGLLKKQMNALAAAHMKLGFLNESGTSTTINVQPIKEFELHATKDDRQLTLWPGYLTVHEDYKNFVMNHAVPLPMKVLASLSHSALALDVASFLAKRLPSLERPVNVPDQAFKEQFGQEYKALKDFKKKFIKAMKEVLPLYPDAKVRRGKGYFRLSPSKPLVPKNFFPLPTIEGQEKLSTELKSDTIKAFRKYNPGLDVYACKADFDAFIAKKTFPDDYQKAFLGFAKKWAKDK